MAIKDLLKKATEGAPKKTAAKKAAVSKRATKKEEGTENTAPAAQAKEAVVNMFASAFLVRPHVSEKAALLKERGVYTFDVPVVAEKVAIKKAVEALYGVKVLDVRTVRHAGKPVYRGKRVSARNTWKKAIVTLAKGQTLDLYQGV